MKKSVPKGDRSRLKEVQKKIAILESELKTKQTEELEVLNKQVHWCWFCNILSTIACEIRMDRIKVKSYTEMFMLQYTIVGNELVGSMDFLCTFKPPIPLTRFDSTKVVPASLLFCQGNRAADDFKVDFCHFLVYMLTLKV